MERLTLKDTDEANVFILNGGLGARAVQTGFVRSFLKNTKLPLLLIDDTSQIAPLVGQEDRVLCFSRQAGNHPPFPYSIPISNDSEGNVLLEHPMFLESWRKTAAMMVRGGFDFNRFMDRNWERTYGVDYGTKLTSLIHQHKMKDDPKAFIGHLYAQILGLEWPEQGPLLKRSTTDKNIAGFLKGLNRPLVLFHLGADLRREDFNNPINYRIHKVWSNKRWSELALKFLKAGFEVAQIFHHPINSELPGVTGVQVNSISESMQVLEGCEFWVSVDSYLPHIAASTRKRGVVLWGSTSPNVWGWPQNRNIWNQESCSEIGCWRPSGFDAAPSGGLFVCDHYSCMRSISVNQVVENVEILKKEERNGR